jgi:hypothetical protein
MNLGNRRKYNMKTTGQPCACHAKEFFFSEKNEKMKKCVEINTEKRG